MMMESARSVSLIFPPGAARRFPPHYFETAGTRLAGLFPGVAAQSGAKMLISASKLRKERPAGDHAGIPPGDSPTRDHPTTFVSCARLVQAIADMRQAK
jgi:hypothetical protein